jgi:hypothetical protein
MDLIAQAHSTAHDTGPMGLVTVAANVEKEKHDMDPMPESWPLIEEHDICCRDSAHPPSDPTCDEIRIKVHGTPHGMTKRDAKRMTYAGVSVTRSIFRGGAAPRSTDMTTLAVAGAIDVYAVGKDHVSGAGTMLPGDLVTIVADPPSGRGHAKRRRRWRVANYQKYRAHMEERDEYEDDDGHRADRVRPIGRALYVHGSGARRRARVLLGSYYRPLELNP